MRTLAFVGFQCRQYLLRWRWLLPIPAGLLLGYWAGQVVAFLSAQSPAAGGQVGNALEAFIWAFGKPEIVYFVASALLVYLVSDLLPDTPYGQWALLRLQSRRAWWGVKVGLVFFATLMYAALLFASFFLMAALRHPFSNTWSPAGLVNGGMSIGFAAHGGSPLQAGLWIAALLLVGWFAIGLLVLTVNQLTQRNWCGFLAGGLVVVSAPLGPILGGAINQRGWMAYVLIYNHLEYTPLWVPVREMPVVISLVFWLVWIAICFALGLLSSKRQDFLSVQQ